MTKPIARDPIYRQRAFEMSSPYQLSSTHPVCGYQKGTPLAICTPHLAALRFIVRAALDSCSKIRPVTRAVPAAIVGTTLQATSSRKVPQQSHRARPQRDQAALCVDGRIQVIRECGHHDRRHRVGPSHS
jgi:hypothetical protein